MYVYLSYVSYLIMILQVTYFVGVQMHSSCSGEEQRGLRPEMEHLSVVGAVKVAVRSSSMLTSASTS